MLARKGQNLKSTFVRQFDQVRIMKSILVVDAIKSIDAAINLFSLLL